MFASRPPVPEEIGPIRTRPTSVTEKHIFNIYFYGHGPRPDKRQQPNRRLGRLKGRNPSNLSGTRPGHRTQASTHTHQHQAVTPARPLPPFARQPTRGGQRSTAMAHRRGGDRCPSMQKLPASCSTWDVRRALAVGEMFRLGFGRVRPGGRWLGRKASKRRPDVTCHCLGGTCH